MTHEIVAGRTACTHGGMMRGYIAQILQDRGEGIVLRRPLSPYEPGRSNHLVKLKHENTNRPNGTVFTASQQKITSGEHAQNLQKGTVVTVAYDRSDRNGMPLNAQVVAVRRDLNWRQVLMSEGRSSNALDGTSQKAFGAATKPASFWKSSQASQLRAFIESYARDRHFDPLIPESWYPISRLSFVQVKGATAVLSHFAGSLTRALISLFPDVNFDESKFISVPRRYWKEVRNRKRVFDQYAKQQRFDPLVASNWYIISYQSLISTKGISSVLQYYYNNNVVKALLHIYPNIGLNKNNFFAKNNWTNIENRRAFLQNFANFRGFDPLVAENWDQVSPSMLKNITFYNGNLTSALYHLFFKDTKLS